MSDKTGLVMEPLAGRVAVVTGSSRGIGRAVAIGLADSGADVAVNFLTHRTAAKSTLKEIEDRGRRGILVQADISRREDVEGLFNAVQRKLGIATIVVNNAAVLSRRRFLDLDVEEFDRVLGVNLRGCFLVGQLAAQRMVAAGVAGRIINISSVSERLATPNLAHYAASKAAVVMLSRVMAVELGGYGISVNVVAPGVIETDMTGNILGDRATRAARLSRVPLGRFGRPDDVANLIVFLAGDAASYMTGASIPVDGGYGVY